MKIRVQFDNPQVVDRAGFWWERNLVRIRRERQCAKKTTKRSQPRASSRFSHSS